MRQNSKSTKVAEIREVDRFADHSRVSLSYVAAASRLAGTSQFVGKPKPTPLAPRRGAFFSQAVILRLLDEGAGLPKAYWLTFLSCGVVI